MAYDVQDGRSWDPGQIPFYHALRGTDADEITATGTPWLAERRSRRPLGPAVFSPLYGKLTDRFRVTWIIDVVSDYQG